MLNTVLTVLNHVYINLHSCVTTVKTLNKALVYEKNEYIRIRIYFIYNRYHFILNNIIYLNEKSTKRYFHGIFKRFL